MTDADVMRFKLPPTSNVVGDLGPESQVFSKMHSGITDITSPADLSFADIRTSFINSPGAPMLVPPPSVTVALPPGWGPQQQAPELDPMFSSLAVTQQQSILMQQPSRIAAEPVVALAAVAAAPADAASNRDLDVVDSIPIMPPLAALDNILDGLIVAPSAITPASSVNSSAVGPSIASASTSSSRSKRSKRSSSNVAAAAPAVLSIQCEVDWERELAAAAAHDQLVVVKVESSRNPLVRPGRCFLPCVQLASISTIQHSSTLHVSQGIRSWEVRVSRCVLRA